LRCVHMFRCTLTNLTTCTPGFASHTYIYTQATCMHVDQRQPHLHLHTGHLHARGPEAATPTSTHRPLACTWTRGSHTYIYTQATCMHVDQRQPHNTPQTLPVHTTGPQQHATAQPPGPLAHLLVSLLPLSYTPTATDCCGSVGTSRSTCSTKLGSTAALLWKFAATKNLFLLLLLLLLWAAFHACWSDSSRLQVTNESRCDDSRLVACSSSCCNTLSALLLLLWGV
jgi:hypothetical protein